MGVYSTDTMLDPGMTEWILRHIAVPTVRGMAERGYALHRRALLRADDDRARPQVLEFNARFGDPETQAILLRLESDLVEALEACIDGRLAETGLRWRPGASACVVASSAGYPGSYKTGLPITGLDEAAQVPGVQVFHSGSSLADGQLLTAGGRVLGVTAAAPTLEEALARAYEAMALIHFEGMYYRRDIGHRALKKKP
jgi:phosphoribosylamine--glycine ligase